MFFNTMFNYGGPIMTLIKWPGGKSREIKEFEKYIPAFNRYIEPMVGGGAVFFYLSPKSIN